MQKLSQWLGILFIMVMLVSCSQSGSQQSEGSAKKAVSNQALAYIHALQNQDYEKAYRMLSETYGDAGVTLDDFQTDMQMSELNLKEYNVKVDNIMAPQSAEKSQENNDDKYYHVYFHFESKGETGEDYTLFQDADIKWVNQSVWFHYENGKWRFFAAGNQRGVTWQPDAYQAALTYAEAMKNHDAKAITSTLSSYFTEQGETLADVSNKFQQSGSSILSFDIKEITADLNLEENDGLLTPEMKNKLIRVKGVFLQGAASNPDDQKFEWYFHLENGEWKYLTDDAYNFSNYAINTFLKNDDGNGASESGQAAGSQGQSEKTQSSGTNQSASSQDLNDGSSSQPKKITSRQLDKKLADKENVIVYFYSQSCGPFCDEVTPFVDSVAEQYSVNVRFFDVYQENKQGYDVNGIPTLKAYKAGKEVSSLEGISDYETVKKWILDNQ